ncbi:MAG: energy-coupling factor transporter transmembrane component T [Nitrososphaeria archaeon]|nr:energy-coupling factor transporter transmembrane component T [Conexivisphaerales archaeon]
MNRNKSYGIFTSFLVLLTGSTLALMSYNIYTLTAGVLFSFVYGFVNYKKQLLPVIKFSAWVVLGFVLSQAFFYWGFYSGQKTYIIFWVIKPHYNLLVDFLTEGKGIAITYQGIIWGIISSAKLLITLFLAFSFSKRLNPKIVLNALKKIHVPPLIALGAAMTFRLLPEMAEMSKTLYSVSRIRKPKKFSRITMPYTFLKALIYNSVKKAFVASLALETKGLPDFTFECEEIKRPDAGAADLLFFVILAFLIALNFIIF